jgi:hypothetical protein
MGIHREGGYSASIEAYLRVGEQRISVAKTGHDEVVVAEPCELPPGCEAELVVIVDGTKYSRTIVLDGGIARGESSARYSEAVPF